MTLFSSAPEQPPPLPDTSHMVRAFVLGGAVAVQVSLAGEPWAVRVDTYEDGEEWLDQEEIDRRLAVTRAYKLGTEAGLPLTRHDSTVTGYDFEVVGPKGRVRVLVWAREYVPTTPRDWRLAGLPAGVRPLVIRQARGDRQATDNNKIKRRLTEALVRGYADSAQGGCCEVASALGLDEAVVSVLLRPEDTGQLGLF